MIAQAGEPDCCNSRKPVSQRAGIPDSLRNRRPRLRSGLHPRSGSGDRRGEYRPVHRQQAGRYTDDQFTANWDREFRGGNDKVSARFFFSNAESFLPFGAGGLQASLGGTLASSISANDLDFPYDLPVNDRFFSVDETHLFSSAVVNDFRFGFVRINNSLINVPPVTADDLGIDRPTNNVTDSIYKFSLSGFQIGPTPPADQFQTQNNYNFVETVSWVKGAHILRFGGEYTRVNLDKMFPQVFNGQLFFVNSLGSGGNDRLSEISGRAPRTSASAAAASSTTSTATTITASMCRMTGKPVLT